MKSFVSTVLILFLLGCNTTGNSNIDQWWTAEDRNLLLIELKRTTEELIKEVESLSSDQWNLRIDSSSWTIAEIVEHLEMQNQLHYREISVMSNTPQHLEFRSVTEGQDSYFTAYATDTIKSSARWFLTPRGRYPTIEKGMEAFLLARKELTKFVASTEVDLRKQFTFRTPVEGKPVDEVKIGQVRDLHQLLLTGIAHTDRHLTQIRKIKGEF